MARKKLSDEVEKQIDALMEKHRENLYEVFDQDTFGLTFDEREKLISGKMKHEICEILEKHIKEDPQGICGNSEPDESCLCDCGTEALLCRDEHGNIKIHKRVLKTKSGPVTEEEYGYYCSKCRRLFFSTKKNP
jgi:hypothetical protein